MTESEFNDRIDETLELIEETLDDAETDIDVQLGGGILTIICENKTQIIFTRQAPVLQLWVATRSGGFHFDFDTKTSGWVRDSDAMPLDQFLTTTYAEQAGENLTFSLTGA